jgi:hypothetical protein
VGPCPLIGVRSPVNIYLLWHVFWPKGRMHMPSYANGQESRASNRQTPNWMMICPANVRIIAHEKVALVDCAWNLLRASFDVCSNAQHDLTTPSRTYIFFIFVDRDDSCCELHTHWSLKMMRPFLAPQDPL